VLNISLPVASEPITTYISSTMLFQTDLSQEIQRTIQPCVQVLPFQIFIHFSLQLTVFRIPMVLDIFLTTQVAKYSHTAKNLHSSIHILMWHTSHMHKPECSVKVHSCSYADHRIFNIQMQAVVTPHTTHSLSLFLPNWKVKIFKVSSCFISYTVWIWPLIYECVNNLCI